jgi:hypothetical protein
MIRFRAHEEQAKIVAHCEDAHSNVQIRYRRRLRISTALEQF